MTSDTVALANGVRSSDERPGRRRPRRNPWRLAGIDATDHGGTRGQHEHAGDDRRSQRRAQPCHIADPRDPEPPAPVRQMKKGSWRVPWHRWSRRTPLIRADASSSIDPASEQCQCAAGYVAVRRTGRRSPPFPIGRRWATLLRSHSRDEADVICSSCGTENKPGRRFCVRCAAPLASACPSCGSPFDPGDTFCGECAAPLPPGRVGHQHGRPRTRSGDRLRDRRGSGRRAPPRVGAFRGPRGLHALRRGP